MLLRDVAVTTIEFVLVMLAADLCSGIVHWLQDRYDFNEKSLLNRIVILYAEEHHHAPDAFTHLSWSQRNAFASIGAALILSAAYLSNAFTWQFAAFVIVFLFSGEVHLWSHRAEDQNGLIIRLLQRTRLIQRPQHHALHHKQDTGYYCILTDLVNPVVDYVAFFPRLEAVVFALFGIGPKAGV